MTINAFQIHLLLNHIPLFAVLFAFITLLYGTIKKSEAVFPLARLFLWLGVACTVTAFLSGDAAEEASEALKVGFSEHYLEEHEEIAEAGLIIALVWGTIDAAHFAVKKWFTAIYQNQAIKTFFKLEWALIALWLVTLFIAAHQGGMIKHDEIRPAAAVDTAT